jgi:hypothetical protein
MIRSTWFGSSFSDSSYWSGTFECSSPDCNMIFYARIKNPSVINDLVKVELAQSGQDCHRTRLSDPKASSITGSKRKKIGLDISAKGYNQVICENITDSCENNILSNCQLNFNSINFIQNTVSKNSSHQEFKALLF